MRTAVLLACAFTALAIDARWECDCSDNADCADGNMCTEDFCIFGCWCRHTDVDCDDGDPCTLDTCHPDAGCVNECVPGEGCSCSAVVEARSSACVPPECCSNHGQCRSMGSPCTNGCDCIEGACVCDECDVEDDGGGCCEDAEDCEEDAEGSLPLGCSWACSYCQCVLDCATSIGDTSASTSISISASTITSVSTSISTQASVLTLPSPSPSASASAQVCESNSTFGCDCDEYVCIPVACINDTCVYGPSVDSAPCDDAWDESGDISGNVTCVLGNVSMAACSHVPGRTSCSPGGNGCSFEAEELCECANETDPLYFECRNASCHHWCNGSINATCVTGDRCDDGNASTTDTCVVNATDCPANICEFVECVNEPVECSHRSDCYCFEYGCNPALCINGACVYGPVDTAACDDAWDDPGDLYGNVTCVPGNVSMAACLHIPGASDCDLGSRACSSDAKELCECANETDPLYFECRNASCHHWCNGSVNATCVTGDRCDDGNASTTDTCVVNSTDCPKNICEFVECVNDPIPTTTTTTLTLTTTTTTTTITPTTSTTVTTTPTPECEDDGDCDAGPCRCVEARCVDGACVNKTLDTQECARAFGPVVDSGQVSGNVTCTENNRSMAECETIGPIPGCAPESDWCWVIPLLFCSNCVNDTDPAYDECRYAACHWFCDGGTCVKGDRCDDGNASTVDACVVDLGTCSGGICQFVECINEVCDVFPPVEPYPCSGPSECPPVVNQCAGFNCACPIGDPRYCTCNCENIVPGSGVGKDCCITFIDCYSVMGTPPKDKAWACQHCICVLVNETDQTYWHNTTTSLTSTITTTTLTPTTTTTTTTTTLTPTTSTTTTLTPTTTVTAPPACTTRHDCPQEACHCQLVECINETCVYTHFTSVPCWQAFGFGSDIGLWEGNVTCIGGNATSVTNCTLLPNNGYQDCNGLVADFCNCTDPGEPAYDECRRAECHLFFNGTECVTGYRCDDGNASTVDECFVDETDQCPNNICPFVNCTNEPVQNVTTTTTTTTTTTLTPTTTTTLTPTTTSTAPPSCNDTWPETVGACAVLRDLNQSHPDVQNGSPYGVAQGMVNTTLGVDDTPVLNDTSAGPAHVTDASTFYQWFHDSNVSCTVQTDDVLVLQNQGPTGPYVFSSSAFFPLDGLCFGNEGRPHNYHFTMMARLWFVTEGAGTVTIKTDDDAWIFIDGELLVDLGGVHAAANVNGHFGGLAPCTPHRLDLFWAERQTVRSELHLTVHARLLPNCTERGLDQCCGVDCCNATTTTTTLTPTTTTTLTPTTTTTTTVTYMCSTDEECDDDDLCTLDECVLGMCVNTNQTDPCECHAHADCVGLTTGPPTCNCSYCCDGTCEVLESVCDDGDNTTADECRDDGTSCVHAPLPGNDDMCTIVVRNTSGPCMPSAAILPCFGAADVWRMEVPVVCDDDDPCTVDSCNQSTGCVYDPRPPEQLCCHNDSECDDGNACTTEICVGVANCTATCAQACVDVSDLPPAECASACNSSCAKTYPQCMVVARNRCDDQEPCDMGACNATTGQCRYTERCDDGDRCTNDTCLVIAVPQNATDCSAITDCELPECESKGPFDVNSTLVCLRCNHTAPDCDDGKDRTEDFYNTTTCECYSLYVDCITCECDDGNTCTYDWCDRFGDGCCVHDPIDCDDGDACTEDWCDDARGGCQHWTKICDDGDACTNDTCDPATGQCVRTRADCSDGKNCTLDECDPVTGQCSNEQISCDQHGPCVVGSCENATGLCVFALKDCSDGKNCTYDVCLPKSGICVHPSVDCSDPWLCTIDSCEETPAGAACRHDSVECNQSDPCVPQRCDPRTGLCADYPIDCDDEDWCTDDVCLPEDGGGECAHYQIDCEESPPDLCTIDICDTRYGCGPHINMSCDDGEPATDDSCVGGQCRHVMRVCDDRGPCVIVTLSLVTGQCEYANKSCADVDLCTKDECVPATGDCAHYQKDCDDNKTCTVDTCDWQTGWCINEPIDCDDGNLCTSDRCNPATGQCDLALKNCSEGLPNCVVGWCVPETGECATAPRDCDDGDLCTDDWCDNATGACARRWNTCDNGDWCTLDLCRPSTGECVHPSRDCDDRNACTVDWCNNDTKKCGHSSRGHCDDHDRCTTDVCNERTAQCSYIHTDCDDRNPCTNDTCDAGTGACRHDPLSCYDGNPCTRDVCHRDRGGCRNPLIDCDNGDPRTNDFCRGGVCFHRWRACPDDGDLCTVETLDPDTGRCVSEPIVCVSESLCVNATCGNDTGECVYDRIDCDDGMNCTRDECDEGTGGCINDPVDCDDGDLCTTERCDVAIDGCAYERVNCTTSDPCMVGECEPRTGQCIEKPVLCDAGGPCAPGECVGGECVYVRVNCTTTDRCLIGRCDELTGLCATEALECDDEDPCTLDWCSSAVGCRRRLKPCAPSDLCHESMCETRTGQCIEVPVDCDDGDPLTVCACNATTGECGCLRRGCDDGNLCVRAILDPLTGECLKFPVRCDDEDRCTINTCDPDTGACRLTLVDCDDEDACTTDSCDSRTGQCLNVPFDCDDRDECTTDWCDGALGACIHDPVSCDDGDRCTVDECYPGNGVCYNTERDCDDRDWCTVDICNGETGGCKHVPKQCPDVTATEPPAVDLCVLWMCHPESGDCYSERRECESVDPRANCRCVPETGECVCRLKECDDDDPCTDDELSPIDGRCYNTPKDCADGNLCTDDWCDDKTGTCGHNQTECECRPCQECWCVPSTGECEHRSKTDEGGECDDGLRCTVDECDARTSICWHYLVQCENPRDRCDLGRCNPFTGECVFVRKNCDDANECTDDRCNQRTGNCEHTLVECEPSDACHEAYCHPATGQCVDEELTCDDVDRCTRDTCNPRIGCQHELVAYDDPECAVSTCSPDTGQRLLENRPDGAPCNQTDPCIRYACYAGECMHESDIECKQDRSHLGAVIAVIVLTLVVLCLVMWLQCSGMAVARRQRSSERHHHRQHHQCHHPSQRGPYAYGVPLQ